MNIGRKRKGRSDRTHLIYQLTVDGKSYIGLTYLRKQSVPKTMRARLIQHWYNAHTHKHGWGLSEAIRSVDTIEDISYTILARVRGKDAAHEVERKLITSKKPKLNTDIRIAKR
jgi:hypothetical protein